MHSAEVWRQFWKFKLYRMIAVPDSVNLVFRKSGRLLFLFDFFRQNFARRKDVNSCLVFEDVPLCVNARFNFLKNSKCKWISKFKIFLFSPIKFEKEKETRSIGGTKGRRVQGVHRKRKRKKGEKKVGRNGYRVNKRGKVEGKGWNKKQVLITGRHDH